MPIRYALRENKVAPTPGTYAGQIVSQGTATEADLVARMLKAGTTLTETDIRAVFSLLPAAIADVLADGRTVTTGFANYGTGLTGTFPEEDAPFDPSAHRVHARVSTGLTLKKRFTEQVRVERVDSNRPEPRLKAVYDATTRSKNDRFTAGAPVRITGANLKFDESTADEGVYFQKGTAAPVRAAIIVRNTPSELIVVAPASVTGTGWTVEVRNRFHKGTDLRKGGAPAALTVA